MSVRPTLHRARGAPADPSTAAPPAPQTPLASVAASAALAPADLPTATTTSPISRVPRTRTGAAWIGLCAAALTLVGFIVFMLQNTGSVDG